LIIRRSLSAVEGGGGSNFFEMAIYEQLPVFKASYDLLIEVFETDKHLTRDYIFSIGERSIDA
jgi:hypothetical protein